jgi:hypothetical protein
MGIILSTSNGSDESDDTNYQESEKTKGLDHNGDSYQIRTQVLIGPEDGQGTYGTEAEGDAERDGQNRREHG